MLGVSERLEWNARRMYVCSLGGARDILIAFISNHTRDAGGSGGNMASYFGRQQSAASMASLPPDEVEFELDLEVRFNWTSSLTSMINQKYYYISRVN